MESKARPFAAASSYLGKRVGGGGSPAIRRGGHGNATVPGSGAKSGDAEGSGRGDTTAQAEKRGPRAASGGEDRAPGGHGGSGSRRDKASSGGESGVERISTTSEQSSRVHACGAGDEERSGAGWTSRAREGSQRKRTGMEWKEADDGGADVERSWSCERVCPPPAEIRLEVGLLASSSEVVRNGLSQASSSKALGRGIGAVKVHLEKGQVLFNYYAGKLANYESTHPVYF